MNINMKKVLLAAIALALSFGAKAQIESHVKWSYAAKKNKPYRSCSVFKGYD